VLLVLAAAGAAAVLGLGALNLAGAAAGPLVLAPGEEKTFGLFDPHLHVALIDVAVEPVWGTAPARGEFHAVRIRVRNDAARILIDPSELRIFAIDDAGGAHDPLAAGSIEGPPIDTDAGGVLRPGDAHERTLLFDLPAGTRRATLWVGYRSWLARLLADDKRGFPLRRVVFDLRESAAR
jgi:hypothetical protein